MDILNALREEESKYVQLANYAKQQLETVRAAMKLVHGEANASPQTSSHEALKANHKRQ